MSRSRKNIAQDSSNSKWIKRAIKRQGSLHEPSFERASSSRNHPRIEQDILAKTFKRFGRSG